MGIRDAFETETGLVLATTLHTIGAIGVIAALVLFLAWVQRLRTDAPRDGLRRASAWTIWVSIAANMIGGLMRTYLPGHPSVTDIGHSPWVQVMLLKHVFIFAAMGALLHLHYVVAPWLEKRLAHKALPAGTPSAQAFSVFIVVLGVLVASVLGGFAQITPLGPGHEMDDDTPPDTVIVDQGTDRVFTASSTLTSTPLAPQADRGSFQLRPDVVELAVVFLHDTSTPATLALELTNPNGESHDVPADGQSHTFVAVAGVWQYEVTSQLAANVGWTMEAAMALPGDGRTALAESVSVAPGAFFEINTQMPLGGTFCWDWSAGVDLAFDVHSHFDGVVEYYVERTSDGEQDCFTNEKEGGYSLLWANEGAAPAVLDYRVWGEFTVDSYFPPR